MNAFDRVIANRIFQSEVIPAIETTNPSLGKVIEWADKHPVVWQIVTTRRSKAFGIGSCEYIGWAQRSSEPGAVLERVRHIYEILEVPSPVRLPDSIFIWRVQFTLAHYADQGFRGGFFQQHDKRYPRSCLYLDYTRETLSEVIDRFCSWMDKFYDTRRVTIDGVTVRTFPQDELQSSGNPTMVNA